MIFICSFLVLALVFIVFMMLVAAGVVIFSKDEVVPPVSVQGSNVQPVHFFQNKAAKPKVVSPQKQKAYIDLNGRFIELLTKAEETKAKKDGFKIVYK